MGRHRTKGAFGKPRWLRRPKPVRQTARRTWTPVYLTPAVPAMTANAEEKPHA